MANTAPSKIVDEANFKLAPHHIYVKYDPDTHIPSYRMLFSYPKHIKKDGTFTTGEGETEIIFHDFFYETPATVCMIRVSGSKTKFTGVAFLSPSDCHSISYGMKISLERAIKTMKCDSLDLTSFLAISKETSDLVELPKGSWWKKTFKMLWSNIRYASAYAGVEVSKDDPKHIGKPDISLVVCENATINPQKYPAYTGSSAKPTA